MPIQPINSETVAEQVAKQIKKLILNGELQPGDKLDSERNLAQKFNVGRNSVREGLKILQSVGVTEKRSGGYYVNKNFMEGLFEPLSLQLLMENTSYADLFDARILIEKKIVGLAIDNIDADKIKNLDKILLEAEKSINLGIKFTEYDVLFHVELAKIANNSVLTLFINTIRNLLTKSINKLLSNKDMSVTAMDYHKKIFFYIKNKDKNKAQEYMVKHLQNAKQNILKLNEND